MNNIGFSIRCPHCFEWSDWADVHPAKVVIGDEDEQRAILHALQRQPDAFSHPKMLSCKRSSEECPAPFQAFVCKDRASAHRLVQNVPTWVLRRAFRLYRTDHRARWEDYSGIIFCTQPVPRQKHIQLEHMLDRELLTRSIAGMGLEFEGPVTVYAAKIFEVDGKPHKYWIPVEAYTRNGHHVPPRYNLFCDICRRAAIAPLLAHFEQNVTRSTCPLNFAADETCASERAACVRRDWNRCPAFLDARQRQGLCYTSDCRLIEQVENEWRQGALSSGGYSTHTCWAGLTEIAVPVIVHEHILAVVMAGQLVTDGSALPPIDDLVRKHAVLEDYRGELENVRALLLGNRHPKDTQEEYAMGFRVDPDEFKRRVELSCENAERIAAAATARYRHVRTRFETVFKQEMLGHIEATGVLPDPFREAIRTILNRMREFWAFTGVYFLVCPLDTKELSMIGYSRKSRGSKVFEPLQKVLGIVDADLAQTHPLPWLYDRASADDPPDAWVDRFRSVFKGAVVDPELDVPTGRCYFLVSVPFVDEIYAFVFAVRDEKAVSPLRPLAKDGISELCQAAILETCTEVVRQCREVRRQKAREEKIKLDAWRDFSMRIAHLIDNQIFVARGALRVLRKEVSQGLKQQVEDMASYLDGISRTCKDFRLFSGARPPDLRPVNVAALITGEVERYRTAAERHIHIDIRGSLPVCRWDSELIRQALGELLENAIHYTPKDGDIWVNVEACVVGGAPKVRILVGNTGPGIAAAYKQDVFAPLFTQRPSGTGLGLAIVAQNVRKHQGTVVENGEPGENARFVLDLPAEPTLELTDARPSSR